mgnify:CR=1 FL=1
MEFLTKAEIRDFLILASVFAFLAAWHKWGVEEFNFLYGSGNYLISLIAMAFFLAAKFGAQKLVANFLGIKVEQSVAPTPLILAVLFVLLTNGKPTIAAAPLTLWAANKLKIEVAKKRLKKIAFKEVGLIAIAGPIANLLLAIILWPASKFFSTINIFLALFALIPIPPFEGYQAFFTFRLIWAFAFGAIVFWAIFAALGISSIIFALLGGALGWFLFYFFVERKY